MDSPQSCQGSFSTRNPGFVTFISAGEGREPVPMR